MSYSDNDTELLALVGEVFDATEPVPGDAVDVAYAAGGLPTLEHELATLVFDSHLGDELALTRSGDDDTRMLSFRNERVAIDLELHGDGTTIVGQVSPADPEVTSLHVETPAGERVVADVDGLGRFRATAPDGAVRMRIPGWIVTPWIAR